MAREQRSDLRSALSGRQGYRRALSVSGAKRGLVSDPCAGWAVTRLPLHSALQLQLLVSMSTQYLFAAARCESTAAQRRGCNPSENATTLPRQ